MVKVEKVSKRSQAIAIMNANGDKSMAEVVVLIADAINVTEANAKSYYRYIVEHKLAAGASTSTGAVQKSVKTKEVPAKKLLKEVGVKLEKPKKNRFAGNVKTTAPKTEDEVSRIKAANLARMKEISERNKVIRAQYNGNIARGADDPFDPEDFTPESARAELEAADGLESFSAPRFLSKDAVKALV